MSEASNRVTIGDIDVPFVRLVAFFVKVAFAMIPAALIVWLILALLGVLLAAVLGDGFWIGGMHAVGPRGR